MNDDFVEVNSKVDFSHSNCVRKNNYIVFNSLKSNMKCFISPECSW